MHDGMFLVTDHIRLHQHIPVTCITYPHRRINFQNPCHFVIQQITSRILRLQGEEDGRNRGGNVDTYSRFVYIHGTNQEEKLGSPNSHGCILLGNADVVALFDALPDAPAGTPCARLFVSVT